LKVAASQFHRSKRSGPHPIPAFAAFCGKVLAAYFC
jgi:hypothetical protein